jgi:hypothetical protein
MRELLLGGVPMFLSRRSAREVVTVWVGANFDKGPDSVMAERHVVELTVEPDDDLALSWCAAVSEAGVADVAASSLRAELRLDLRSAG